jgi:phosphate transport system ATP-binding protein
MRAELENGAGSPKFEVRALCAWFGDKRVLHGINLGIAPHQATAVIGPSGCGKSTFIRCLNRMHELVPSAYIQGEVRLDGVDVYERGIDPVLLRRRVGMVFQKANPFPSMSVRENVLAGLRLTGSLPSGSEERGQHVVERALSQAALWDEVKDRLDDPGVSLSSGQQQRLCIARALAVNPDVLLMDEPCSALDPIASARIEDLIHSLKQSYTIVVVTHSMQQAARVSDLTAFFLSGSLIEFDSTDRIFTSPKDSRTEDYITGKFG